MKDSKENAAEDQPLVDELGQVLVDAQRDSETLKESKKFEKRLEYHKKCCIQIASRGLKSWVPH